VSGVAQTSGERPVFFSGAGEDLFGIITEPVGEPKGVALVLLGGGGFVQAISRNRLSVRIARRVAALGYHSLRLDYHGFGESSGELESIRLERPFVDDVLAGVRCLQDHGVREIALAGWCFGARTALASADRIPGLRGVALLATPINDGRMGVPGIEATPTSHYLRRVFSGEALRGLGDARRRRRYLRIALTKMRAAPRSSRRLLPGAMRGRAGGVSPLFSDPLAKLAARGTPVLLAYGTEDNVYGPFRKVRPELAGVLEAPGARVEERLISGGVHSLSQLEVQDAVVSMIEEWLQGLDAHAARAA
jgi:pimeloyl-ACP methyl ester carboxylesterase